MLRIAMEIDPLWIVSDNTNGEFVDPKIDFYEWIELQILFTSWIDYSMKDSL